MLARTTFGATDVAWQDNRCAGVRWRTLSSGDVEIEGEGVVVAPAATWPKAVDQWRPIILSASKKHGVPAHIIAGIMAFESAGKQNASSFCCYGLMALMPSTAALVAKRQGLPAPTKEQLLSDPALNVDLGTALLAELMRQYKGELPPVAVGYNAGRLRCGSGCEKAKNPDTGKFECIGPCPPNPWNWIMDCARFKGVLSTSNYPTRVVGFANYALRNGYPLQPAPPGPPEPPAPEPIASSWFLPFAGGVVLGFVAIRLVTDLAQAQVRGGGRAIARARPRTTG